MPITRHPARCSGTSVATLLIGFFVAGCNDGKGAGSVGPESVGPELAEGGEPVSASWTCDTKPDHPSCAPPSPGTTFDVTIVSDQISSPDHPVTAASALDLHFENFTMDLGFFNTPNSSCKNLSATQLGTLHMIRGDADGPHVHVGFSFEHTESPGGVKSKHRLSIDGLPQDVKVDWGDPTTTRVAIHRPSKDWAIAAKGRNHQNGCNASGDGVEYTITAKPAS